MKLKISCLHNRSKLNRNNKIKNKNNKKNKNKVFNNNHLCETVNKSKKAYKAYKMVVRCSLT
jgi:hypothetical protein